MRFRLAACLVSLSIPSAWAGSDNSAAFTVYTVDPNGVIAPPADKAVPSATNEVVLQPAGSALNIRLNPVNGGTADRTVAAAQAELRAAKGNIFALAGNNGGIVRATDMATVNGHVWLTTPGSAIAMAATQPPMAVASAIPAKRQTRSSHLIAAKSGGSTRMAGIN